MCVLGFSSVVGFGSIVGFGSVVGEVRADFPLVFARETSFFYR